MISSIMDVHYMMCVVNKESSRLILMEHVVVVAQSTNTIKLSCQLQHCAL